MKFRNLIIAATLIIAALTTACTPPYRQKFEDAASKNHWTHKEMLLAFAAADRLFWAHELKEGSNQYIILYGKVPTAKVAAQVGSVLSNIDALLDPNDPSARQYLDTFNLREDLKHEEEVGKAQYARLHAADLQDQFNKKMGESPEYGPEAEMSTGYNIRKIFSSKPLDEVFPFKSEAIEGAKKDGTLKQIESLQLDFNTAYDHKAVDPLNPQDANEFVWKAKKMSIQLTNYKIINEEKPQDNKGNYIEGFRVIDGKKESKPALKVFFPSDGSGAVALIDTDRENETGFGLPDILATTAGLENVTDVIRNGDLLATLFQEKKNEKRILPPHNLFKIEISTLDKPIDPWEKSAEADGWVVPFKYQIAPLNENYNIRLKFKKVHVDPLNTDAAEMFAHSEYMELEYIAKEYTKAGDRYTASPGKVIEYFRPQGEAAKKCQAKVLEDENTKKVQFTYEDGSESTVIITNKSKLVSDKPYAKSYTEGNQRFWVESSEDNGKYDKRKKVSEPKDSTGSYSDDSSSSYLSRGDAPNSGGGEAENKHKQQ